MKIEYETITIDTIIIDQISRFLKNCLVFELDFKNPGMIKIKTTIKKIAGTICSNHIFNYLVTHSAHTSSYCYIYFFHFKIREETTTTEVTITDQMNIFLANCFDFKFVDTNIGRTRIKSRIKKIAGTISPKFIS